MQASLQTAANNFTGDFDREITHIYFTFQMMENKHLENQIDPPAQLVQSNQSNQSNSVAIPWQTYSQAYQKWLANTRHPKLIKDLYFINNSNISNELWFEVLKLDPETNKFQLSTWPKELTKLRESLVQNNIVETSGLEKKHIFQTCPPILTEVPALVIPCSNSMPLPRVEVNNKPNIDLLLKLNMPSNYVVAVLDLNYIQQQWLPSLTNQYFASGNQLDYYVAIVNNNVADGSVNSSANNPANEPANKLIYQSSQQFTKEQLINSDLKQSFFSLRPEELDKFFFVNVKTSDNKAPVQVIEETKTNKTDKTDNNGIQKIEKHTQQSTTISIVQTNNNSNVALSRSQSPVLKVFGRKSNTENSSAWQLVVKHHSGSLDVAVNSVRQRNLAVSSGILILLAISMVMILISTRRAQSLAKQQMEFVAGVSHELRTPLAVICSAGENLADGVVNNFDQVKRYGGLVKSEGRRLSEMVEQILEFAGWQSHRKTYNLQPTSVENVISNAILACKPLIIEANFQVNTNTQADLPLVNADPAALQRAIQNLISNAIKYSRQNNQLEICTTFQAKTSQVEIKVIDKGIGISQEELPHIFEPFYRGQEVMDAQIHGSGLGLSLVKQIVTACGGKITVSSVPNQGSTFTIYLPLAKKLQAKLGEIKEAKEIYE